MRSRRQQQRQKAQKSTALACGVEQDTEDFAPPQPREYDLQEGDRYSNENYCFARCGDAVLERIQRLGQPPMAAQKPEKWEFIGTYTVGIESVNAVIDPDSIRRDGIATWHLRKVRFVTDTGGRYVT